MQTYIVRVNAAGCAGKLYRVAVQAENDLSKVVGKQLLGIENGTPDTVDMDYEEIPASQLCNDVIEIFAEDSEEAEDTGKFQTPGEFVGKAMKKARKKS